MKGVYVLGTFGVLLAVFNQLHAFDNCRFKSGNFKGCPYEGKCIAFGKQWISFGGVTLRCGGNKKSYVLESVTGGKCRDNSGSFTGCLYRGSCKHFNQKWEDENGSTKICVSDNAGGFRIKTVTAGFCRDNDGGFVGCPVQRVCHGFGNTWVTNDCFSMICQGNKWGYRTEIIKGGCRTSTGKCVGHGQTLSATMHGKTYENCTCKRFGLNGSRVTCRS